MTTYRALTVLIALALSLAALPRADGQGTSDEFVWVHQFGTSSDDYGSAVAVDGSSVYIAGRMLGSFPGDAYDAYLRKYDVSGSVLWIRQFGTDSFEYANAVATNGSAVYVAGLTGGSLEGGVPSNGVDAFLRTYDVDGNVLWTRQFGSIDFDTALAVAVDGTSAYVAGRTEGTIPGEMRLGGVDAFIRKYSVDRNGTVSWTRQFGTSAYDVASSLAVDATGMYVAGQTGGSFPGETLVGGADAFLRKYDVNGDVLWTRQFGTMPYAIASALAVDTTGVYVAGQTGGSFPGETSAGGADVFLRKYDVDGNVLWTRQFGSTRGDAAFAVAINQSGVYITGQTDGLFPGETSAGSADAYLLKYDVNGNHIGTRQFGTSGFDKANGVAVGGSGVYVAGETGGALPGNTNAGGLDAFLVAPLEPMLPVSPPATYDTLVLWLAVVASLTVSVVTFAVIILATRRKQGGAGDSPRVPPPAG